MKAKMMYMLVHNNDLLKPCQKFALNHKYHTWGGVATNGRIRTHVYITISIKFGELTILDTRKQKISYVEDGPKDSGT